MRLNLTLFILLLSAITAQSQKLTGIWRGYFSSSPTNIREGLRTENYKYEIQIEQLSNNSIKGVTYSYKTTVFYGKADLTGIYNVTSKSLIIRENKLSDLKVADNSEPCLMTCYLDYTKIGKIEMLEGTFISINEKDKSDCGSGKVYLEKVPTSDFKKEDFLLNKKKDDLEKEKQKESIIVKPPTVGAGKGGISQPISPAAPSTSKDNLTKQPAQPPVNNKPATSSTPAKSSTGTIPPKTTTTSKKAPEQPNTSKKVEDKTVKAPIPEKPVERVPESPVNSKNNVEIETQRTENTSRNIVIPKVLIERENNLVRTITTSEEDIQIELYDNGTIDNDTISVYHNNELVVKSGRLSYSPISIKIKCSKTNNRHELIVVADNLGDIPPNTALMVIKAGGNKQRYEVFLSSTEQRNAKVVINYVPKE